jgi:outer membrane protein TolC
MMLRRACTLALAWLLASPVSARPSTGNKVEQLDLRASLLRALKSHPDLGVPRADIQQAQADLQRARAGRFPRGEIVSTGGLISGAKRGNAPGNLPSELDPLFSPDKTTDLDDLGPFVRVDIQLEQPIYTFGKLDLGVAAARDGLAARRAALRQQRAETILEVKRLFYAYQLTRELLRLLREIHADFAEAVEKAEERLTAEEGTVTQADVLKLKLGLARMTRQILTLEQQQRAALAGYRRSLGLPADANVQPADAPLQPVQVARLPALSRLEKVAFERPEWRSVEMGLKSRDKRVELARRKWYPDIFVAGLLRYAYAPGRADITNPFLYDPYNMLEGGLFVGVRQGLDFAVTAAEIEQADAEAARLRAQQHAARLGLPVEIRNAYFEYRERAEALKVAQQERQQSRALAAITLANFRLGLGEARDVLEALGFYAAGGSEFHRAVHDYNLAVARLSRALGREIVPGLQIGE